MKRVLLGAVAVLSLALHADKVKVADVVIANQVNLIEAANKLGSFTGNPTLGMMIAMGMGGAAEEFGLGPMRTDGDFVISVYCDDAAVNDMTKPGTFDVALFYPVSLTKEQFLKNRPEAKEQDGVIKYKKLSIVFASDGKYACIAPDSTAAFAKKASGEFQKAPSLGKSHVARIHATGSGMKILSKAMCVQAAREKKAGKEIDEVLDIIKALKEMSLTFAVSDKGVDVVASYVGTSSSYWDAIGKKTVPADTALSFAGKDAVIAFANAADCGVVYSYGALWADFMSLLSKWGFKTHWQVLERKGSTTKIVFDPVALFNMKKDAEAAFEKAAGKRAAFCGDFEKILPRKIGVKSPEQFVAGYIKGHKIPVDAQKRFNVVMPEFAGKPCVMLGVTSFYGFVKPVGDMIVPLLNDKDVAMYKTMLATLPPVADSTIAYTWVRNGLSHDVTVRFNPSEIKGLYTLISSFAMSMMIDNPGEVDDLELDDED